MSLARFFDRFVPAILLILDGSLAVAFANTVGA